jgi:hypothetical protein
MPVKFYPKIPLYYKSGLTIKELKMTNERPKLPGEEVEWPLDVFYPSENVAEDGVSPEPAASSDIVPESSDDVSGEPDPEPAAEPDPEPVVVPEVAPVAPTSPVAASDAEDEEPVDRETLRRMAGILRKQRHNEITHQRAMEMLEADKELLEKFKNMKTWH